MKYVCKSAKLELREEERSGRISLRYFYLRRSLRLFPAVWLYLLVIVTIWLAGWLPHHPWHSFVSSLFYFRNLVGSGHETDHLWSLSIEEQFYLLWPLVLVSLKKRNGTRLMFAATGLVGVTVWRIHATRTGLASAGSLYIRSDFRFDAPLFGCVLALAIRVVPSTVNWLNSSRLRSTILAIGGAIGLIAWVGLRLGESVYPGIDSTVICLFGMTLILSQVGVQSWVSQWFAWEPLVAIGQISYGVYLWQQLFLGPQIPGFELIRTFPIGLLASFAVAALSYRFLELPMIRLKDMKFHASSRSMESAISESLPSVNPHFSKPDNRVE